MLPLYTFLKLIPKLITKIFSNILLLTQNKPKKHIEHCPLHSIQQVLIRKQNQTAIRAWLLGTW
jgi:hypothetical protein